MCKRKKLLIVVLALFVVPTIGFAQEEGELAGTTQAWEAAFQAGDAAAIAAMMSEDAILMPPNAGLVEGREDIEAYWASFIAMGLEATLEVDEVHTDGDLGYKRGRYELSADGSVVDHGKWIEIWKRVEGTWYFHRDIFNSSMPAADAEEGENGE